MCAMNYAQEGLKGEKYNFWLGLAREGSPEVVTYEAAIAVKYMKSGLGGAFAHRRKCVGSSMVVGREHSTLGAHQKVPFWRDQRHGVCC